MHLAESSSWGYSPLTPHSGHWGASVFFLPAWFTLNATLRCSFFLEAACTTLSFITTDTITIHTWVYLATHVHQITNRILVSEQTASAQISVEQLMKTLIGTDCVSYPVKHEADGSAHTGKHTRTHRWCWKQNKTTNDIQALSLKMHLDHIHGRRAFVHYKVNAGKRFGRFWRSNWISIGFFLYDRIII